MRLFLIDIHVKTLIRQLGIWAWHSEGSEPNTYTWALLEYTQQKGPKTGWADQGSEDRRPLRSKATRGLVSTKGLCGARASPMVSLHIVKKLLFHPSSPGEFGRFLSSTSQTHSDSLLWFLIDFTRLREYLSESFSPYNSPAKLYMNNSPVPRLLPFPKMLQMCSLCPTHTLATCSPSDTSGLSAPGTLHWVFSWSRMPGAYFLTTPHSLPTYSSLFFPKGLVSIWHTKHLYFLGISLF